METIELPEDYLSIKCDLFKIIKANSDKRASQINKIIKNHFPDVKHEIIAQALKELGGFNEKK